MRPLFVPPSISQAAPWLFALLLASACSTESVGGAPPGILDAADTPSDPVTDVWDAGHEEAARPTEDVVEVGPPADARETSTPQPEAGPVPDGAIPLPEGFPNLPSVVRVRIAAANTTSGGGQSYTEPGIRMFQGLKPDIVLIQEFNYDKGQRSLVDTAFGTEFAYYCEEEGSLPNGIVSRYPILASGSFKDSQVDNRNFAWARIDVPGSVDLWAISVHLLTKSASARTQEAKELVGYIKKHIPAGSFLVIGGDFNTDSTQESTFSELSAYFVTTPPYPADQKGNHNTSQNRSKPYDWVLGNLSLTLRQTPVVIGQSTFASGLVFDSRVYTPLTEVAPVQASDSNASQMQHMMVVKDYYLGAD